MATRTLGGLLITLLISVVALPGTAQRRAPEPELRQAVKRAAKATDSFEDRFDAEVWLTDMSGRLADDLPQPERRVRFLRTLHYEAKRAELKPELVLAVIDVESDFNRFALSEAGARGYMQVMPFWLDEIGRPDDNLFNTETNLRLGCTILGYYLDKEDGDLARALARYNGSLGEDWYPERVFDALNKRWHSN